MEDIEIVRKCAERMRIDVVQYPDFDGWWFSHRNDEAYDPLHDKAQAFELAERMMLCIDFFAQYVASPLSHNVDIRIYFDGAGETACRAICECVAKMGE